MKILWLTSHSREQQTFSVAGDEITIVSRPENWSALTSEQVQTVVSAAAAERVLFSDINQEQFSKIWPEAAPRHCQSNIGWSPLVKGDFTDLLVSAVGAGFASYWFNPFAGGIVSVKPEILHAGQEKSVLELLVNQTAVSTGQLPQLMIDRLPVELPGLIPSRERSALYPLLTLTEITDWLPESYSRTVTEWSALQAGLCLWYDELDRSHQLSQAVEFTGRYRAGDYWHAILHRREPDDGNARYWFRQVGHHPLYPELLEQTIPLARTFDVAEIPCVNRLVRAERWDAAAFVEVCSQARRSADAQLSEFAKSIQGVEMILLIKQTLADCRLVTS